MELKINTRIPVPKLSHILAAFCAFSIPIGSGINLITGLPFSKIFLVAVLLLLGYSVFFMKFRRHMNPFFMQVYIAFMVFHTLVFYLLVRPDYLPVAYYGEKFYLSLIRFYVYILFFLFISQFLVDRKTTAAFTVFYSLGYAFTFILGLFVPSSELDLGRINGGFENPNSFGASSFMLIFLNIYQWSLKKPGERGRWIYLCFVLLGLAGLGLSQSRGALAGLVGAILFFILWMPSLERQIRLISGVLIGAGLILLFLPADVIHHFLERANVSARIASQSESRVVIWSSYLKELPEYWLFGTGRNRSNEIIAAYHLPEKWQAPHCRYLFTLVEFGIAGLLSFLLGLFQLYRRSYHSELAGLQARLIRSFMIAWLIMMMFGDYKNSRDFWLFLAIAASATFVRDKNTTVGKMKAWGT